MHQNLDHTRKVFMKVKKEETTNET